MNYYLNLMKCQLKNEIKLTRRFQDSEGSDNSVPNFGPIENHCVKDIRDFNIVINNIPWKVRFIKADSPLADRVNGVCDSEAYIIGLSTRLEGFSLMTTLFHELLHAIVTALSRGHNGLDEEHVADMVGMAIPFIIPQLPKWVRAECESIFTTSVKVLTKRGKELRDETRVSNKRVRKKTK